MRIIPRLILGLVSQLAAAQATQAALLLQYQTVGSELQLRFDSQPGTNYQLQVSTNLAQWADWGALLVGDGLSKTQTVNTAETPRAFYRVRVSPAVAAPSDAEFTARVVGHSLFDYSFTDAMRFSWWGEEGNWDYAATGGSTGKLVFTYDADGNNPALYREEIVLTFSTATQGSYRYAAFENNAEQPGTVTTGAFDLGAL